MLNVSEAFKRKIEDGEPVYQVLEITFPDGTVKTVEEGIMDGGSIISDCAESSSFPIGSVICKSLTVELDNTEEQWKNFSFFGARINLRLKMTISEAEEQLLDTIKTAILDSNIESIFTPHNDSQMYVESIDYGTFTITNPEQYGEIITIVALDDAYKLNSLYYSSLKLPQTVSNLVRDACETLDIPMGFSSLTHGDIIVNEIPDSMTFRQLFGWAAMLECANARIDNKGYLQFVKWDFSTDPIDVKDYLDIPVVSSDDIVITGIRVKSGDNSELYGETGYVLDLENNIIEQSDLATVAALIGDTIIGSKFRNLQGDLAYNPLLEFGDMVGTYDHNMNRHLTPITDISSEINGITTIKTQADDPIRGSSQFVSQGVKAIVEARRLVKIEKTEREKAVERLAGILASSGGLYMTEEPQEDGSTIYYMHNKPTLAESDIIWKLTAEAFAVSIDGGKTYPYGFAVTGELITRLLYAEGINATYINAGTFTVKDKNGKIIFMADIESGTVRIDASYVQIGGSTLDKTLDNMQGQIDGNIETWTGTDTPTLDNYPAKNWLTDEERNKHVGDIYYDSNNQAYRFRYDSEGYNWRMLKDTDVTKALQDAEAAKKQAENAEKVATLAKNVTLQLNNDYATVSVDSEGNYDKFPDITIKPVVMYGSSNITTECVYSVQTSDSVSGSWNSNTYVYTVTALTADNGWVDIRATYLGTLSVTKRFNISKLYAGKNGEKGDTSTSVFLSTSTTVVRKMAKNVLIPSTLSFTSYYLDGSNSRKPYDSIFVIEESEDGEKWKEVYRSATEENSVNHCLYTILTGAGNVVLQDADEDVVIATARPVSNIRCSIYTPNGQLIDRQTVSMVTDATALTQQEIVEMLSDDGSWKGLYYLNGHLYISFDAALGGSLILGGENNGNGLLKIRDEDGNDIGYIDNNGVHFNQGEFSGKVHASQIDGSKVTGSTFLSDNRKTATKVEAGTVRFRSTELDENAYVEDEETGEMIYVGAEDADWSSESDIANAGYMQTSSRYYPDFTNSEVTVEENVAAMELNAFWGLFVKAEKSDIASFGKNLVKLFGRTEIMGDTNISGDVEVLNGNGQVHCNTLWTKYLQVDSTKSRLVDTQNYQKQYLHAFETPTPMFGDCGTGQLNESGEDLVPIDDILLETINSGIEYQVFLQKEGSGDIWVETKMPLYFAVKGTPKLKYSWEIKAVQRDYEHIRWDDMTVIALDTDLVEYDTYIINLQEEDLKDMDEMERLLLAEAERSELASKQ